MRLQETDEPIPFYGAHSNRFRLGYVVYEAIEDESDGYRSMLQSVGWSSDQGRGGFFDTPIAEVTVHEVSGNIRRAYEEFEGWELRDADGRVWLRLGTDNYDDYYPVFVFEYMPTPREV